MGFKNPDTAKQSVIAIEKAFRNLSPHTNFRTGPLLDILKDSADPDSALAGLERLAQGPQAACLVEMPLFEQNSRALIKLLSASNVFSDILMEDEGALTWLLKHCSFARPKSREDIFNDMAACSSNSGGSNIISSIKRHKDREFMRIASRDLLGLASLEETTAELSHTADAVISIVYDSVYADMAKTIGRPLTGAGTTSSCAVISMGKLGSEELNYSSDIDLILVYSDEGYTSKACTTHEFFTKTAQRLLINLCGTGPANRLYRVDYRLRPEGVNGPLVRSFESYIDYYSAYGSTWERLALLKARPSAAETGFGSSFVKALDFFVYRKALSREDIQDIVRIKERIELEHCSDQSLNVKLGRGGIRDIEFIVQFHQLIMGGKKTALRGKGTLQGLAQMNLLGLLPDGVCGTLSNAYRLLRRIEHLLQLEDMAQTHTIPNDNIKKSKLAGFLGYPSAEDFSSKLSSAMDYVYDAFCRILKADDVDQRKSFIAHSAENFNERDSIDPKAISAAAFRDPEKALAVLERLHSPFRIPTGNHNTAKKFEKFLPAAIEILKDVPDPDAALINFESFVNSYGSYGHFYELLSYKQEIARFLFLLGSTSQFLSTLLSSTPSIFDSMFQQRGGLWSSPLSETVARIGTLPEYLKESMMISGARFISGITDASKLGEELAHAMDICVTKIHENAVMQCKDRFPENAAAPSAVFALGSYGSRELSFGSDIDIMFLFTDTRQEPEAHTYDAMSYMAQTVLKQLASATLDGSLFKVDTRLRPDGGGGPLIRSVSGAMEYYSSKKSLWEKMILLRCRPVAGDAALIKRFMSFIRKHLKENRIFDNELIEFRSIRNKIHKEKVSPGDFDLKYSFGGLIDIEFLTEIIFLRSIKKISSFNLPLNIHSLIDFGRQAGKLNENQCGILRGAANFYKTLIAWIRIQNNAASTVLKKTDGFRLEPLLKSTCRQVSSPIHEHALSVSEAVISLCASHPDSHINT